MIPRPKGEVPEWPNGLVSKTSEVVRPPRVRISPSPPFPQAGKTLFVESVERCQSGRMSTLGKRVYRKVPRVQIPPSPPFDPTQELGVRHHAAELLRTGSGQEWSSPK
jgi:hypothetical protein